MYRLHDYKNGFEIWIIPSHVTHMKEGKIGERQCTEINFDSGRTVYVSESVDEILSFPPEGDCDDCSDCGEDDEDEDDE